MSCWNFIDRLYCINLRNRPDRRRRSASQFEKIGALKSIEYMTTERHPQNSEQGIYESHIHCIQKGLEAQARSIAVFEDDVVFENFDPERLENCVRFIIDQPHWDALFFGCLVTRSWPTSSSAVRRIHYRSLAHAYVLNRPFAEKLVKIPWSGRPFDAILHDFVRSAFVVYPSFAFQGSTRSDNYRLRRLDLFRRVCGGLKFIQKMNERFHTNYRSILFLHLLVAVGIAGWLILR